MPISPRRPIACSRASTASPRSTNSRMRLSPRHDSSGSAGRWPRTRRPRRLPHPERPLDRADPLCRRLRRSPDVSRSPARPQAGCGAFGGSRPISRIHVLAPPASNPAIARGWSRTEPRHVHDDDIVERAGRDPGHVAGTNCVRPRSDGCDRRPSLGHRAGDADGGAPSDDMFGGRRRLALAPPAVGAAFLGPARPTIAREERPSRIPRFGVAEALGAAVCGALCANTASNCPATARLGSTSQCPDSAGRSRSTSIPTPPRDHGRSPPTLVEIEPPARSAGPQSHSPRPSTRTTSTSTIAEIAAVTPISVNASPDDPPTPTSAMSEAAASGSLAHRKPDHAPSDERTQPHTGALAHRRPRTGFGGRGGQRTLRRKRPVWLASIVAMCSGGPSPTIVPPPLPPFGPRSMTQSAVLITSRLCSITSTVLP